MAEISDLSATRQQDLLDVDFATLLQRIFSALEKLKKHTVNDVELAEIDDLRQTLVDLQDIIEASGNTAAVTAYAILNP